MAKTATARKGSPVRRQARPKPLTLGEIIAAAFDTAGGELAEVLRVVNAPQLSKVLGRRIVLVP
jgi:hypothetical protein